ncbi:MAG: hypothetical protein WCP06_00480 [Verrucomicrobiota bacterium]
MMNDLKIGGGLGPAESPLRPPLPGSPKPAWLSFLEDAEWKALCDIIAGAEAVGIETLIGGALGLAAYMPLQRRTKDIDFYVMPHLRDAMVSVLHEAGFRDFYEQAPYDRQWIYRGIREDTIADVIWRFANHKTMVDEDWFRYSHFRPCDSEAVLRIIPPEELIWAKLFVLQRDRCDWPDILNLLYYVGPKLDWNRLYGRLGSDARLLDALLTVFSWLCPDCPIRPPVNKVEDTGNCQFERANLLDTREWFLPQFSPPC